VVRPRSKLLWRSGIFAVLVAGGLGAGIAAHASGDGPRHLAAPARGRTVVCGRVTASRPLPARFPSTLPLPAGTAITKVSSSHQKGFPPVVTIQGFAPMSMSDAAIFFLRHLPSSGYQLLRSESEPGLEAEGRFLGNGTSGAYRVRSAPCGRGVALLVGVVLAT
jgi:hypothetical protein